MKKARPVRLLAAGVCALAGLLLLWRGFRPLTAAPGSVKVLALKAAAGDPKAVSDLKDLGSNAVPGLAGLLDYQDPFLRVQGWALVPKLPKAWRRTFAAKLRPLEASGVRAASAKALGLLGSRAGGAVPDLLEALHDPEPFIDMQAASTLGRIGKPAVPGLTKALKDTRSEVRHAAAYGLGEAGAAAEAAVPQLIGSLEDPEPQVRSSSAYSLSLISCQVITSFSNVIDHADPPDRQSAIQELVRFYDGLCGMTPLASKMAHAADADSCRVALEILGLIRSADDRAIRLLCGALKDSDPAVRLAAIKALNQLNWRTQPAVDHLRKCLRDPSAAIRELAARDLGELGSAAGPALEDLKLALQDSAPEVRAAVVQAMQKVEPKQPPTK